MMSVWVIGIDLNPMSPNVEMITPKTISARMINKSVLLGAECQKWFLSRTINIENNAKNSNISKQNVLSPSLSLFKLKLFKPM